MEKILNFANGGNYDVIVVGAGTAGVFAAISAARSGSKTLLLEKNSLAGGTMTSAGVDFPGLFHAWGKQIIDGPCYEAIKRCETLGGADIPEIEVEPKGHWTMQIRLNQFIYTSVCEQLLKEAGVSVYYHTMPIGAEETENGITVYAASKNKPLYFQGKTVIDATGDANITELLGYETVQSKTLQPATLMQIIDGYDFESLEQEAIMDLYKNAIENGDILSSDFPHNTPIVSLRQHRITMHIQCPDASDSKQRTQLEQEARAALLRIISFLRTLPGLENLYVCHFSPECGVRETKRIVGEGCMTVDNYVNGYRYPDAVAYCFYPVDLHIETGIKQIFLKKDIVPTIPYSALIPKGSDRLLVAGRCASGDAESNSAYRVQAPCMAMGQAAGVAASIAAKNDISVRSVPFDILREKLQKLGAIVP